MTRADNLAADVGAGLFALPKATALTTYSDRPNRSRQAAFLAALGNAMLAGDLVPDASDDLDLDLNAIMHWGKDVALETHYLPSRSQRTRSVSSIVGCFEGHLSPCDGVDIDSCNARQPLNSPSGRSAAHDPLPSAALARSKHDLSDLLAVRKCHEPLSWMVRLNFMPVRADG